ncbi:MAG: hypothetical protein ACHQRJ_03790 [Alphaproteobacteria bacterium]
MTKLLSSLTPEVEPFTAADAPEVFKARGDNVARQWARMASSFYRGRIERGGDAKIARERSAARATAEAGRSRR